MPTRVGPTGTSRIIQLHPTRRCNLRCRHCYSSSGPEERDALDVALLLQVLTDARDAGFGVVSFSGGEPLMYGDLFTLLDHAKSLGLRSAIATNGMLLDDRRLGRLAGRADLIAISLDGIPESHNRVRGSERAFSTMAKRLAGLRQSRIPFGFIFTLTQHNLDELEWVANFAASAGASLLQVHPLAEVGRARTTLAGQRPDDVEAAYAFLEVARLRALHAGRLTIQLDLIDRALLRDVPGRALVGGPSEPDALLADLVSPLIVEADGTVVPLQHGFSRPFALGRLQDAPLPELAARWRMAQYPAFARLCDRVFAEVTAPAALPLVNWYEAISRGAETAVV